MQPAAFGMLTGMFISSITLRVNTQLRQRKLMAITDDYENSDYSLFYVHLNQKVTSTSNVGFTVLQFFKLFTDTEFWIFSDPVVGLFYNEETNPIIPFTFNSCIGNAFTREESSPPSLEIRYKEKSDSTCVISLL